MSTSAPAATRTSPTARLRPTPVEMVLTRRILREMWRISRWFWLIAALVATAVGFVISRFTPVTASIWENAGQWPCWWLFSMATALVALQLPMVVLHGVTRRAALRAITVSGVLVGAAWAAFMVVGHVAERLVYAGLGWPDTLQSPHLFSNGYQVLPVFLEYFVIFLAYLVSGALVGGMYYRWGPIRATVLLPLGLLPAVAVELLLATGWYGSGLQELFTSRPPARVLTIASVAVLGLSWLVLHRVLRDVPIKSKK
jgi:hypothetical protein